MVDELIEYDGIDAYVLYELLLPDWSDHVLLH